MNVFVLHHVHELPDGSEDVKFIGVYSSEKTANLAIARLAQRPGFKETIGGFDAEQYVERDHWTEGFVTL